jgi:acyl-CoA synthetase (AMP-forming)/AMP-acid ligase II
MIEQAKLTERNVGRLAKRRPDPMQVAHMGPTGGTTGLPKVVPRTHNSLICGIEYGARAWEMDIHDTCLLAGPIGHDLTFTKGLCGSLFTFGKTVLLDSMDPKDICQTIQQEKVTAIVWVPTLAKRLIDFKDLKDYDLSSLKKMHCGGGVSLPEVIKGVWEKLGCTFFNAYGGTEGQTTITRSDDNAQIILNTVGRPTCLMMFIRLSADMERNSLDADEGTDYVPGGTGDAVSGNVSFIPWTGMAELQAGFTSDRTAVAVGQNDPVHQPVQRRSSPLSYQWDFNNDGTIDSTQQNPTHTYTTNGNYTVTLTISTPVTITAGQPYWLAFVQSSNIVYYNASSGRDRRYKSMSNYSTFSFPNPAGTGFSSYSGAYNLLSGWEITTPSTPPSPPNNVNAMTVSSSQIDLTWNDTSKSCFGDGLDSSCQRW